MKWIGRQRSTNVDDRRGMAKPAAGIGIVGVIIAIIYMFLGGDPQQAVQIIQQQQSSSAPAKAPDPNDEDAAFVSVVLKDTEDIWEKIFQEKFGQAYRKPTLVLFDGAVESACGFQQSATGPFYCPADEKLYIDLSFYRLLKERFKAPGDFAMAYVVAHEVGHHVQHLLGTSDKVHQQQQQLNERSANQLSVRLELQADFYAGLWAHYADRLKGVLEEGDIEEALTAANAIGDDRLQQESSGKIVPDAFTHGTSEQRMYWFKKGFTTGNMDQGDTFTSSR
ncbi:MAG: neutral zinc metallopeptidase [Bacteroidetes bacterium]|nr:neutral zinc metallopeptidase [Bacteroidota bacterium]MBL0095765.1 neutral zinc metallopeptidase [Bacteroidota bacterium]